jgi:hypothetical protein
MRKLISFGICAVIIASVVLFLLHDPAAPEQTSASLSFESIAWQELKRNPLTTTGPTPPPRTSSTIEAPPVASLIDGLESRLLHEPDDAKGWALLAQSYAFIGNERAAERALGRALELGMDEQALREKVVVAAREAPQRDWIERVVGN